MKVLGTKLGEVLRRSPFAKFNNLLSISDQKCAPSAASTRPHRPRGICQVLHCIVWALLGWPRRSQSDSSLWRTKRRSFACCAPFLNSLPCTIRVFLPWTPNRGQSHRNFAKARTRVHRDPSKAHLGLRSCLHFALLNTTRTTHLPDRGLSDTLFRRMPSPGKVAWAHGDPRRTEDARALCI